MAEILDRAERPTRAFYLGAYYRYLQMGSGHQAIAAEISIRCELAIELLPI